MRNKSIMILISVTLIIAITLIVRTYSLSVSGHYWEPTEAYTNSTINCSWTPSTDATAQNITILRNSEVFFNNYENKSEVGELSTSFAVLSVNTSKNQVWTCRIIVYNETDSIMSEKTITIKNTPPSTEGTGAGIFYNGVDIGYLFNVLEDTTYIIDVNATDADNDYPLYYYSGEYFCTRTDQEQGLYSCTPTYIYLVNNNPTLINISFIVSDGQNFGGRIITFNITPVNDAPIFSPALTDKNISEGSVFNYRVNGVDEENDVPFDFNVSTNPYLELIVNKTNSTSGIVMFAGNRTANYYEAGNYTVYVTIIDSKGANTTSSFKLNITQKNVAPVLEEIGVQNGIQGGSLLFYVYANDVDENNTLNFSITPINCSITNPWSITTLNNSRNATGMVNITNLTNNHVVCRNVRILVIDDNGAEDSQDVFLNISNTNDPPNIEVLSSYINNTGGNNISNLTAYAESLFTYLVNVTDPDSYTYEGEVLTFSDNATFFDINPATGLIRFTPNQSLVGEHKINITVSDDGGLSDSKIMNLEIRNNSAPILEPIGQVSCAEDFLCMIIINASDADGDNLSFTSNNTQVFNLTGNNSQSPVRSAYLNFTPLQNQVGVYSIIVIVTDIRGASDSETITFTINNTNDAPVIQPFTFPTPPAPIVETHGVSFYIYANDEDYELNPSYEYVTFGSINISGKSLFSISTLLNTSNNRTYGQIFFTPQLGDAGNYSVNITATDSYGAVGWVVKNFTVMNKTNPPVITRITPYGRPYSITTNFNFTERSNYVGNSTAINFSENRSVIYNITVIDDTSAQENLSFAWYINGSFNSSARYLNLSYNFFSAGRYNITIVVSDDTYESTYWTWNVTVDDLNRAPYLINNLMNLSVNSTTIYSDYLKKTNVVHFLDPDDDLNSNDDFESGETSRLTYNVTNCSVATITITNHSIRVEPKEVGGCNIYFTAVDYAGLSALSNLVFVNVSAVSNSTQVVKESSSGGGGGSSSQIIALPITQQEEIPKALELIVPELVTVYKNETVLIPIILQNNWNSTLYGIRVNASTNHSYVKLNFTDDYFESMAVGERRNTTLMVKNYRLGENYEVRVIANVTTPQASDSALIMLNSIEQTETGEQVETKVTFAQDLLNDNPECAELNELLFEAKKKLKEGFPEEASRMVDGVINGCKYLVSVSKKTEQKPQSMIVKALQDKNILYLLIAGGILMLVVISLVMIKKHREEKILKGKTNKKTKGKEKENEIKEEGSESEIKPYWP